jgi:hypothetical protein
VADRNDDDGGGASQTGGVPAPQAFACTVAGCGRREHVRVACRLCGAVTCFGHREPREHACPRAGDELRGTGGGRIGAPGVSAAAALGLAPPPPSSSSMAAAATTSGGSSSAASAPAAASSAKPLSAKDAALARSIALMRVKGKVPHADLKRVPEASRLFLEARAAHADGSPSSSSVYVCADTSGTVGGLLDALAGKLGVSNPNATTTDEAARLHLYALPLPPPVAVAAGSGSDAGAASPALLPFGARLSALVTAGTVVNGGTVLLVRGLLPDR